MRACASEGTLDDLIAPVGGDSSDNAPVFSTSPSRGEKDAEKSVDMSDEGASGCPVHGGDAGECLRSFIEVGELEGCPGPGDGPVYRPRKLRIRLDAAYIRKLRAKRKQKTKDGLLAYISPTENLMIEVASLLKIKDDTKLATQAFSIVVSLVNHHINQYRKQCGAFIGSEDLEALVVDDLRALNIYGYREWEPESGARRRGIEWDKAIADAIRRNLPDLGEMSADEYLKLATEIDREIAKGAEDANLSREKGLLKRRADRERLKAKWLKWRTETFSPARLMTLSPSQELKTWKEAFPETNLGLTRLREFRAEVQKEENRST